MTSAELTEWMAFFTLRAEKPEQSKEEQIAILKAASGGERSGHHRKSSGSDSTL